MAEEMATRMENETLSITVNAGEGYLFRSVSAMNQRSSVRSKYNNR